MGLPVAGMRVLHAARVADAAVSAAAAAQRVAKDLGVVVATVTPKGRWRVTDAESLCRNPQLVADAAVSVAVGLDDATPAVWDRLLKVVEEPPVPWWLYVAVADASTLPATLLARAVSVEPAPHGDPVDALVALGWERDVAVRLAAALGTATHLAPDPAGGVGGADAAAALLAAVDAADPGATLDALEALCALEGGPEPREVLGFCIDRRVGTLGARARTAALEGDLRGFRSATEALTRTEVAADAVARNVNPLTVLWVLWGVTGELARTF